MKLNFKWKKKTRQFQTGDYLYLNKICVGGYSWNSTRSQHESNNDTQWVGNIDMPSLTDKAKRVYGASPEIVKLKMEQVITNWFEEALKEEKS